ncbi:MAG: hypothetical protein GY943_19205 [Chloroflexi bacterium]|nr:hypothetical protein [Chloroflexota bacterium]
MIEILLLVVLPLSLLALIFWPRKDKYVRDITSSRNGMPYWHDDEQY